MHSFHPSRGRIFFEVLCAAGIAASCGGAWLQTGASALLAAASIAMLYSLVRFFDLFRRNPTVAAEPQRIEFEAAPPVRQEVRASLAAIEPRLVVDNVEDAPRVEQAPLVEEAAPPAKSQRRAKTPRKATGRAKASKNTKDVELSPAAEARVAEVVEPEPFVRQQQRAMFGRKAG